MKKQVKIGFAPTRRAIFSAPDAVKYADLTRKKLDEMGIDYVDIKDINKEGLLYNDEDRIKIQEGKSRRPVSSARKFRNGVRMCTSRKGSERTGSSLGPAR